jgi:ribosome-binding protein aMBF1 (putative translation factor)
MATNEENFSHWLRDQMHTRGLNYTSLAEMAGTARTNVRNWEVGANLPTWHSCRDLARALGVSKEEVRRRAGYVDPEEEAALDEALAEIVAIYPDLEEIDREALRRTARALRGYSQRQR